MGVYVQADVAFHWVSLLGGSLLYDAWLGWVMGIIVLDGWMGMALLSVGVGISLYGLVRTALACT